MSKSLGNVADPFAAMHTEGVDVVRFYLARVGGRWKDDVGQCLLYYYLPSNVNISTHKYRLVTSTAHEALKGDPISPRELLPTHHLPKDLHFPCHIPSTHIPRSPCIPPSLTTPITPPLSNPHPHLLPCHPPPISPYLPPDACSFHCT